MNVVDDDKLAAALKTVVDDAAVKLQAIVDEAIPKLAAVVDGALTRLEAMVAELNGATVTNTLKLGEPPYALTKIDRGALGNLVAPCLSGSVTAGEDPK